MPPLTWIRCQMPRKPWRSPGGGAGLPTLKPSPSVPPPPSPLPSSSHHEVVGTMYELRLRMWSMSMPESLMLLVMMMPLLLSAARVIDFSYVLCPPLIDSALWLQT
ncbi:unnamed protein product [Prorocentrum cordatum]|uniref:Uncharacterized protein n=1 Tax=Prorocentrum cordatum TaxID=2364126 RepID=A0ABN9RM58_9DINO|nr:unnamed protein product [Polarella glacialis]